MSEGCRRADAPPILPARSAVSAGVAKTVATADAVPSRKRRRGILACVGLFMPVSFGTNGDELQEVHGVNFRPRPASPASRATQSVINPTAGAIPPQPFDHARFA